MPTLCSGLCTQRSGPVAEVETVSKSPAQFGNGKNPPEMHVPRHQPRPAGLTMPGNFPKQGGTSAADQAKVQAGKQQEAQWLG